MQAITSTALPGNRWRSVIKQKQTLTRTLRHMTLLCRDMLGSNLILYYPPRNKRGPRFPPRSSPVIFALLGSHGPRGWSRGERPNASRCGSRHSLPVGSEHQFQDQPGHGPGVRLPVACRFQGGMWNEGEGPSKHTRV